MAKKKYYVVWEGRNPGVYETWEDCQEQVEGWPGAKFKSFSSQEEAVTAFRGDGQEEALFLTKLALKNIENATSASAVTTIPVPATPSVSSSASSGAISTSPSGVKFVPKVDYASIPEINLNAVAVDGACAGNPGMMEYRGVKVATGEEIFHVGPLPDGTNNIAEYLAIVHALALLFRENDSTTPIYTDSGTAVAWVRNRGCRTQMQRTEHNRPIFELIARANAWIRMHRLANPILRWNTPLWGDIPADFSRK